MASQDKLDRTYMNMAVELSKLSYAKRKQVGCLIVKNTQIISEGYNGTPKGFPNDCECLDNITKPEVLHAESNAISKIARSTNSSDGSTLYVTLAPYPSSKEYYPDDHEDEFGNGHYKGSYYGDPL